MPFINRFTVTVQRAAESDRASLEKVHRDRIGFRLAHAAVEGIVDTEALQLLLARKDREEVGHGVRVLLAGATSAESTDPVGRPATYPASHLRSLRSLVD